jgi:hypothetical protein
VRLEIVHDDDLPSMETGNQKLFDIQLKGCGVGRTDPGIRAAPMLSRERAAMSVVSLPRLRGTLALARFPLGARAYRGVKAILKPHSSMKTSNSVEIWLAFARQTARSSLLRSIATSDFFSCPAQPFDGSAHRKASHALTMSLFPEVTVLLQGGIVMCL